MDASEFYSLMEEKCKAIRDEKNLEWCWVEIDPTSWEVHSVCKDGHENSIKTGVGMNDLIEYLESQ